jgi:hypothetical protein
VVEKTLVPLIAQLEIMNDRDEMLLLRPDGTTNHNRTSKREATTTTTMMSEQIYNGKGFVGVPRVVPRPSTIPEPFQFAASNNLVVSKMKPERNNQQNNVMVDTTTTMTTKSNNIQQQRTVLPKKLRIETSDLTKQRGLKNKTMPMISKAQARERLVSVRRPPTTNATDPMKTPKELNEKKYRTVRTTPKKRELTSPRPFHFATEVRHDVSMEKLNEMEWMMQLQNKKQSTSSKFFQANPIPSTTYTPRLIASSSSSNKKLVNTKSA